MRLGREQHKAMVQGREDEINQMQQEITSWMERRKKTRERKQELGK